jgi:aminoglycoside phosphotransferase (APT) family kinase protein
VGLNELARIEHGGRPAARKRYSVENTRRYKIFGSGARNESVARPQVGDLVPEELAVSTADGCEEVLLEWRPGTSSDPDGIDGPQARSAGRVLAHIHRQHSSWYGSLDGAYRFERQSDAFAPRWAHAIEVLAGAHPRLAAAVERWARSRFGELNRIPPVLVHGDFGPRNLLWAGADVESVLDWEFARYGDPREDWAVIDTGRRHDDPNSFGRDETVSAELRAGYLEGGGSAEALEPAELYCAYYAAVFGVVMPDPRRIAWLAERAETLG